jgi:hypothetical protein
MEQTLHILEQPIRAKKTEWLFAHDGRVTAARETGEDGVVDILAYSDNRADTARIKAIANIPGGCTIRNISEPGVDYIDEFTH